MNAAPIKDWSTSQDIYWEYNCLQSFLLKRFFMKRKLITVSYQHVFSLSCLKQSELCVFPFEAGWINDMTQMYANLFVYQGCHEILATRFHCKIPWPVYRHDFSRNNKKNIQLDAEGSPPTFITYTYMQMELLHTKGHTSNPSNKCPKRGLMTTGGQIPIEKHYRSFMIFPWQPCVSCRDC